MGAGDTFHFYSFVGEDENNYCIKLSDAVAAVGGFSNQVSPRTVPPWPFHARNLRHVYGKSASGSRTRVPIHDASVTIFISGGSFTLHGVSYDTEGAIGEKRKFNSVA